MMTNTSSPEQYHGNAVDFKTCLLWGTPATRVMAGSYCEINSVRAGGKYRIDPALLYMSHDFAFGKNAKVTTWLVNQRRNGVMSPLITTDIIESIAGNNFLSYSKKIEQFFYCINQYQPKFGLLFNARRDIDKLSIISAAIEAIDVDFTEVGGFLKLLGIMSKTQFESQA